jgi:cytochrome c-type biogenesis protein CcmH
MTSDIATLRRQVQQLEELRQSGALGEEAYVEARAHLERRIVDVAMSTDVEEPAATQTAESSGVAARPSRTLVAGLIGGVIVLAAAGYWWTGSPGMALQPKGTPIAQDDGAGSGAASVSAHALGTEQLTSMVDKLAQRLKDAPQDAEGWAMLGRTYAVLGRHADAVPAYEKAIALRGDDPVLLADLADALAVKNNRDLSGEPMALVQRALKLDPDNLKALSLSGTAAFDRKDYAAAVAFWEHIVKVAPPDSSYLPQVQASLAEARELGRLPAASPASAAKLAQGSSLDASKPPSGATGQSVSGTVSLSAALRAQADPNDTVFVFARAAEGPPNPPSNNSKQVQDQPQDLKLDHSIAMSPHNPQ